MSLAIAITLLFASATSALGVLRNLKMPRAVRLPSAYAGAAVGAAMTAWFAFAGLWVLWH